MVSPFVPRDEIIGGDYYKINKGLFVKLFKGLSLLSPPLGRAAGGIVDLAAFGGKVSHLESRVANATWVSSFIPCRVHIRATFVVLDRISQVHELRVHQVQARGWLTAVIVEAIFKFTGAARRRM